MKKGLTFVVIIAAFSTGTSCKKDYTSINDQKQLSKQNATVHQIQSDENNAKTSCQAPCPHAVAYYISVLSTTNSRTRMRLHIQYYFAADRMGKFNVLIKPQAEPHITIGRFAIDNVLPTASEISYNFVEKEFVFPANLSSYPSYQFFINGQSRCDDACCTYIAYYPNIPF